MTETLSEAEKQALKKLLKMIEPGDDTTQVEDFSVIERSVIREMISFYESFKSLGRFAHTARQFVIWAAIMLGALYASYDWLTKVISKALIRH